MHRFTTYCKYSLAFNFVCLKMESPKKRMPMPKKIDINALFDATVTVFAERGYAAATTSEIAQRAGVNEVTLFRRYGTKAALIEAALGNCLARSPFGHIEVTGDVRADLMAIAVAYRKTFGAYGGAVLTLLIEMPRHPELRGAVSSLFPNMQKAARMIASHQAAGRIRSGDPMQKVMQFIAPIMVAGIWTRAGAQLPTNPPDLDAVVDGFLVGHGTERHL